MTGDDRRPRLRGRSGVLADLQGLVGAVRRGDSGDLVIVGEPGAGRTVLLDDVCRQAAGLVVLRAWGVPTESAIRFGGIRRLLGQALHEEAGDRARLGDAVVDVLAGRAAERPVLVLVDDVQWLDAESVEALGYAARRLVHDSRRCGGIGFVLTARSGASVVDDLADLTTRVLEPLDEFACRAVIEDISVVDVPVGVVADLAEGTAGNPRALVELTGLLPAGQLLGTEPLADPLPIGPRSAAAFGSGFAALDIQGQHAATVLAADTEGDRAAVIRALELGGHDVDGFDAVEAMVMQAGGCRHPLVRSACYEIASPAARRRAHLALTVALAAPDDTDLRAWHRAAADAAAPDELAHDLEAAAGRARRRSGHAGAAALLARSAALSSSGPERCRRSVLAAAEAVAAGRSEQALALLVAAERDDHDGSQAARIAVLRGEVELRGGVITHAYAVLTGAAERLESAPAVVEALVSAGEAAGLSGDVHRLCAAADRADALSDGSEGVDVVALVDLLVGSAAVLAGDDRGTGRLRLAVDAVDACRSARTVARIAMATMLLGDDTATHSIARRAIEMAAATGEDVVVPQALEYVVGADLFRGAFDAASAHAAEAIALADRYGQDNSGTVLRAYLALIGAFRGDETAVRLHAADAWGRATANGLGLATAIATWALAMVDLGAGRAEVAADRLNRLAEAGPGAGHPVVALLSMPHRVEALVQSDEPDLTTATIVTAAYAEWADRSGQSWAQALAARCQAMVADGDEAEAYYRRALTLHGRNGRPFDRARTELGFGELLRRRRSRGAARVMLQSAWEAFDRLGAGLWEQRARAELRATGQSVAVTPESGPPGTDLTAQERRIAQLVASGATNREVAAQLFLSPRTVDYHLRKVFVRLGISSRIELAALPWPDEPAVRA